MIRKIILNSCLFLCSIIFCFFICECFLRVYNPFEQRIKNNRIVLPINKKHVFKQLYKSKKSEQLVFLKKNKLGFRGDNPPKSFDKYLSIITVGGSTTECLGQSDGKDWTSLLGKKLKKKYKNLWINNAGIDGCSTIAHLYLLNDYIVEIKPKVVLFLIGANDFWSIETPFFLNPYDSSILKRKISFNSLQSFIKSLEPYSEVIALSQNFFRYIRAKKFALPSKIIDFNYYKNITRYDIKYFENWEKDKTEKAKINLIYYKNRLENFIKICKENSITPVFITQPIIHGPELIHDDNDVKEIINIERTFVAKTHFKVELVNNITRDVGVQNNILVIDLAKKMPNQTSLFMDRIHFSDKGCEIISNILDEELQIYLNNITYSP